MNNIDTRIQAELDRAAKAADDYRAKQQVKKDRAWDKWCKDSTERARANCLPQMLGPNGRIDDNYTASDFPLDIGWIARNDGPELVYVAIGGVNVINYLPPCALDDVRSHIDSCWEDEQ